MANQYQPGPAGPRTNWTRLLFGGPKRLIAWAVGGVFLLYLFDKPVMDQFIDNVGVRLNELLIRIINALMDPARTVLSIVIVIAVIVFLWNKVVVGGGAKKKGKH